VKRYSQRGFLRPRNRKLLERRKYRSPNKIR